MEVLRSETFNYITTGYSNFAIFATSNSIIFIDEKKYQIMNKKIAYSIFALIFIIGACKKDETKVDTPTSRESYLWGISMYGGTANQGTIFKMKRDGSSYSEAHSFENSTGVDPTSIIPVDANTFLGTTLSGTFFEFNVNTSTYTSRFSITDPTLQGALPVGDPVLYNGKYYGMCSAGGASGDGAIYSYDKSSAAYSMLFEFSASISGKSPEAGLVLADNHKFYGCTSQGGVNNYGVLFSFNPANNTYNKIHDFDMVDGMMPVGKIIKASDGKLYGLTSYGGLTGSPGTIFKIDPSTDVFSTLYNFPTDGLTGMNPFGGFIEKNGILYGTTDNGGVNNSGVIFKFDPSSFTFQKLYDFSPGNDGNSPNCDLIFGSDGKIYGHTIFGGGYNHGTAFSYDVTNNTYTKIHDFGSAAGTGVYMTGSSHSFVEF